MNPKSSSSAAASHKTKELSTSIINLPYKKQYAEEYANLNLYGNSTPPKKIDKYLLSVSSSPLDLATVALISASLSSTAISSPSPANKKSTKPPKSTKTTTSQPLEMGDFLTTLDVVSCTIQEFYSEQPTKAGAKRLSSGRAAAATTISPMITGDEEARSAAEFLKTNENKVSRDPQRSPVPNKEGFVFPQPQTLPASPTSISIDAHLPDDVRHKVAEDDKEYSNRLEELEDHLMTKLTLFTSESLINHGKALQKRFFVYLLHPLGANISTPGGITKWTQQSASSIPESAPKVLLKKSVVTRELLMALFMSFCYRSLDTVDAMQKIVGRDDLILSRLTWNTCDHRVSEFVAKGPPEKKYTILSSLRDHMVFFEDASVQSAKNRFDPLNTLAAKSLELLVREGFTDANGLAELERVLEQYMRMFFQLICFISDLDLSNSHLDRGDSLRDQLAAAFTENGSLSEANFLTLRRELNSLSPAPKTQHICERLEALVLGPKGKKDAFSGLLGTFASEKAKQRKSALNSVTMDKALEALRCTVHLALLANTGFRMERFVRMNPTAATSSSSATATTSSKTTTTTSPPQPSEKGKENK